MGLKRTLEDSDECLVCVAGIGMVRAMFAYKNPGRRERLSTWPRPTSSA